jgi:hypothetical protein
MVLGKRRRMEKFSSKVKSASDSKTKYAFVIQEFKNKKLYSSSGQKVTNPAQARAIAYRMAYGFNKKTKKGKSRKKQSIKPTVKAQAKTNLLTRLRTLISRRKGSS